MTLWGGRFSEGPDDVLWAYTVTHTDRRLLRHDVAGSIAHVEMLGEVGLLDQAEINRLLEGLHQIAEEATTGEFVFEDGDEDVHSAVERRLGHLIGSIAGKLHTGRSRNDQVALDLVLYLRTALGHRRNQLVEMIGVLVGKAEGVGETIVPSYTHLQQAQVIPLGHHLLAYAWMLKRDVERMDGVATRLDVSPLGAGASGGSSLPIDPRISARHLGMARVFANSLDAIASRDVAAEYGFVCTQAMVNLSRLSEELVLWATSEFAWVVFSDRLTTGSSALPHKKNPDIAELARGRSAGAIGDLAALLALQKGLPLAYNRDLQEDKEYLFRLDDALAGSLTALAALVSGAEFDPPRPSGWVTALDLAEALVERGVPFREAHQAVGKVVASTPSVEAVTFSDLADAHPAFRPEDLSRLDAAESITQRRSHGAGSAESVAGQLQQLREWLPSSPSTTPQR